MKTGGKIVLGVGAVAALIGGFLLFKKKDDSSTNSTEKVSDNSINPDTGLPYTPAEQKIIADQVKAGRGKGSGINPAAEQKYTPAEQKIIADQVKAGRGSEIDKIKAGRNVSGFSDEVMNNMQLW